MNRLLLISSNSSAIIQTNTFAENNFLSRVYEIQESSTIQLNHVTFTRNKINRLLLISSNSRAIIQNNTLTENNISSAVYYIKDNSTIQLSYVKFVRNKIIALLWIYSSSSAIIQNNTLTENVSWAVYYIQENSTIQLNHVKFVRNKIIGLLWIYSTSSAIIQYNTLTENNISSTLRYISGSCIVKLINDRLIGNSLDRMFYAYSSYLEINAIFVENNTFSKLILAFECNVNFHSMKIRKNDITSSIVYLQNSAGKMTTTYIDNWDNFMASAFTTTDTYLGNRYFPFEIANTQIVWSNALPVSARPIIQLSGNVSLANVNLSVTSLFETEILRYSTKDVPLLVNGLVLNFPNIYIISSLFISCIKASLKHIAKAGTFRCIPCARCTYTLENESLNTSLTFQSKNVTLRENANITCVDCPVGANCTATIKSKTNFYGYETKNQN